jgi:excisionase family DNA binding protein
MFDYDDQYSRQKIQKQNMHKLLAHAKYGSRLFYSPKEAAEILQLSYYQVFTAIRQYRLDAIRIGSIWRIPWTAIMRFVEEEPRRESIERAYYEWVEANGGKKTWE